MMLATPEVDYYAAKSKADWMAYAERHGYGFRLTDRNLLPPMNINWSKIEAIRQQLNSSDSDWIFSIDADSYIVRQELPLAEIVKKYEHYEIIFAPDTVVRLGIHMPVNLKAAMLCQTMRPPNCGFMFVKNCDFSRSFFQEWLDLARGPMAEYAAQHPRNQNVLWRGLFHKYRSHLSVLDREIARTGTNPILDLLCTTHSSTLANHDKAMVKEKTR